jgi:hypothetical protein
MRLYETGKELSISNVRHFKLNDGMRSAIRRGFRQFMIDLPFTDMTNSLRRNLWYQVIYFGVSSSLLEHMYAWEQLRQFRGCQWSWICSCL